MRGISPGAAGSGAAGRALDIATGTGAIARALAAQNPDWAFAEAEPIAFAAGIPYSHDSWRGRIRASAGVGASLPPDRIARFDAELGAILARDFPADPLPLPREAQMIVARRA